MLKKYELSVFCNFLTKTAHEAFIVSMVDMNLFINSNKYGLDTPFLKQY